jgi:diguanylate cyclase (GGDEF)-like protein
VRLFARNDASLAIALIAATVILFHRPLRYLFEAAHEFESRYQVDLLPALILLSIVFTFHQYRKRASARAEARAAEAEAFQARTHSHELEELMAFGQALANAIDVSGLQQVMWKYLPRFARGRTFWVLARNGDRWEPLLHDPAESRSLERLEQLALSATAATARADATALAAGNDCCFPLIAAGTPVGVMGVAPSPALSREEHKAIGAAAALMAVSVRNLQILYRTRELGLRDELTGCFNRVHALERLDGELRRTRRSGNPVSILICDLDHFKAVNDQVGQREADEVLKRMGAMLAKVLRSTDVRCRSGGDEFLIILPETPMAGAERVAECVRKEVATLGAGEVTAGVTASIGIATSLPEDRRASALLERADAALAQAKRDGRNRVCAAARPPGVRALA